MPQPIYLVDAFAHAPFTGNPAAVCPLEAPRDEGWMQSVAMEMNQAETAFFWPEGDSYGLRWFTPAVEVDLCGHATLATTHAMYETGVLDQNAAAKFRTKSGELSCKKKGDMIEMDFPDEAPHEVDPFDFKRATGVDPVWFGANRMDWFVVLKSERQILDLSPDMTHIAALGARGVIVTAKAEREEADFVSRFFAPQSGIPEDPVTGSAHCALGPYWAGALGKQLVTGYQASPRGGYVQVEPRGDRVALRGQARTTLIGELKA